MIVDLSINPAGTTDKIVRFIKDTVHQAGFSKVAIGLSGGIDSAVSFALVVKSLGQDNIYAAIFPYGQLNKEGLEDARLLVKHFNIPTANIQLVDIMPLVDPLVAYDPAMEQLRKGNIMVRVRMILLYDLAKKHKALVLGTENKTEHLLGYFTRFGDEASDIEPIRGLYKTQVRKLASYLLIPEKIINKPPTAGMWVGQTDEGEFGFTYKEADQILYLFVDQKKSREEIIKLGFTKEIMEKVINRITVNSFKHKLPHTAD